VKTNRVSVNSKSVARVLNSARLWAPKRKGAFLPSLIMFLTIMIMVVPQGLDFQGINGIPTSSDWLSKIVWQVVLWGSGYLIYRNLARLKALLPYLNPFLVGVAFLALASVLWSIEPAITLRRVIRMMTILVACLSFCVTPWHDTTRFQDFLRSLATSVIVVSIIFCLTDPELALHHGGGDEIREAWHGITIGKNILGSLASTTFILWLHAWMAKQTSAAKAIGGMTAATICLIGTRSSMSIMATALAVMFMLLLLRSPGSMRRYMPYLVSAFAALILVYALAILKLVPSLEVLLQPIVALTGKDLTFSNRTAIWEVLDEHIRLSPWFGSGYCAYWIGPTPLSPSFEMLTRLYFYPTEGHNGYLDVINDLGIVGGLFLLGYFWSYIRQSLTLMKFDRYQGGLYLTLIFRGFMADMSESHWFLAFSFDFVIMSLATFCLGRSLLQAQLERKLLKVQQQQQREYAAGYSSRRVPQ